MLSCTSVDVNAYPFGKCWSLEINHSLKKKWMFKTGQLLYLQECRVNLYGSLWYKCLGSAPLNCSTSLNQLWLLTFYDFFSIHILWNNSLWSNLVWKFFVSIEEQSLILNLCNSLQYLSMQWLLLCYQRNTKPLWVMEHCKDYNISLPHDLAMSYLLLNPHMESAFKV